MARIYAGILGPLAFLTSLVRGGVHGGTPEAVLWDAWQWLWVLAGLGWLLGWIAQRTIDEAILSQLGGPSRSEPAASAPSSPTAQAQER